MLKLHQEFIDAERTGINRIHAAQILTTPLNTQGRDTAFQASLMLIPAPKHIYAVRFQRLEQFSVNVLARNANEACAEAVALFKAQSSKVQLLTSILDYFTTENLSKARKG